jgi:hypothetical protein
MSGTKAEAPSETLAKLITKALRKERLIGSKNLHEVTQKLTDGTATGRDWRVWIENPIFARGGSDEKPN